MQFLSEIEIVEKPIKKSAKKFQNKEKPMSQYKIAPSILAADYANFEREIKRLEATGAGIRPYRYHGWSLLYLRSALVQVWLKVFALIVRWSLIAT